MLSATAAESVLKMYAIGYALKLLAHPAHFLSWARKYGVQYEKPNPPVFTGNIEDIKRLRRDIGTGGRWITKKAKKEYGKHKTLRGTKVYLYMDDDFIRYNVIY